MKSLNLLIHFVGKSSDVFLIGSFLTATTRPRTGKIIKNVPNIFEREENFLQNAYITLHLDKANRLKLIES